MKFPLQNKHLQSEPSNPTSQKDFPLTLLKTQTFPGTLSESFYYFFSQNFFGEASSTTRQIKRLSARQFHTRGVGKQYGPRSAVICDILSSNCGPNCPRGGSPRAPCQPAQTPNRPVLCSRTHTKCPQDVPSRKSVQNNYLIYINNSNLYRFAISIKCNRIKPKAMILKRAAKPKRIYSIWANSGNDHRCDFGFNNDQMNVFRIRKFGRGNVHSALPTPLQICECISRGRPLR